VQNKGWQTYVVFIAKLCSFHLQNTLEQYEVEKQALNAIFTLKKLERNYSAYEIEEACRRVLVATNRPTVKSIQTIIKTLREEDKRKSLARDSKTIDKKYGFTRGASYYGGENK